MRPVTCTPRLLESAIIQGLMIRNFTCRYTFWTMLQLLISPKTVYALCSTPPLPSPPCTLTDICNLPFHEVLSTASTLLQVSAN